jgi:CheY-like chemotaxis protein
MRVLVADDDKQYLTMIGRYMDRWEFDIETVDNGGQALKILQGPTPPDIAILDWNMPVMTGPEVCRLVRNHGAGGHYTYLILITGNTSTDYIIQGLDSGADDYIAKPFDPGELFARLNAGRRTVMLHRTLQDRISELQRAMKHIKTLQGLLPICCHCKNVRDDSGYWNRIEEYITQHSDADFTHSICPDCLKTHYPEVYERRKKRNADTQDV